MSLATRYAPDKISLPAEWTSRGLRATLDLTRTTTENTKHWRDADALSARAAYPKSTRKIARERSRLEAANNSWYAGMLRTAANHIVGTGPRLQVLTDNPEVNARIESCWRKWAARTRFAEKLRIAVETYWRDGEVFGLRATSHVSPVGLDLRLYEGDQVSQPYTHITDPSIDDGKRVDNLGNLIECWIYDRHPGDIGIGFANFLTGNWYAAREVWHLYRADRPGQLRGIPRCTPAIDWLAHMRRFSKATLSAAELAALLPIFVKTTGAGVTAAQMPEDMMTVDYVRGVMNFLPEGHDIQMPDPKHPATTNEMFQRTELMYFCRCANMPYSLACGTSKDSNFASAKMDIKNLWEPEVRAEQDTITNVVLNPVFHWFLEDCVLMPSILDGAPPIDDIEFRFDWPPLPQADEIDVANAATLRMTSGQTTPRQECMARGEDYDAKIRTGAADYGVSEDEYKRAIFAKHFAIGGVPGGSAPAGGAAPVDADADQPPMSAGAFVGTKRRDFTNNLKQQQEALDHYESGGSELVAKTALMRLGLTEADAISLIDERRQKLQEVATP